MALALGLAWRLFRQEARRGELTIILVAIVLAVSSVLSLSLFSERLQQVLTERSAAFLAADAQLRASEPITAEWQQQAIERGLATARQTATRSMVFAGDNMALVDVRAVNEEYPLKGQIMVSDTPFSVGQATQSIPAQGEVWMDSRLFELLSVPVGGRVEVGNARLQVTKVLNEIPDAGFSVFNTDPMVLMNVADLASADITGPGSRVSYKLYLAGESATIAQLYDEWKPRLNDDIHRWQTVEDDESPIGRSVARAERYFLLASLLAIVLAAVAIAVAAQRFSQRQYDPVAIMKTLGASQSLIRRIFVIQVGFISLAGVLMGVLIGLVIQAVIAQAVADQISVDGATWHWRPLLIAVGTGLVCALLFSLYPLLRLFSVPPLRVLRRDMGASLTARGLQSLTSAGAVFALMWLYSGDLVMSAILLFSGVVLVALLLLVTRALIIMGHRFGRGSISAGQLAWARIRRRAMDNSVQLISFSITLLLLLIVLVMRNDMIAQWRAQLPEGTPNYFVINITEQQRTPFEQHFRQQQVPLAGFYPVVRGRFAAINEEQLSTDVSKEEDSNSADRRQGLGREANISWGLDLQKDNQVVAGEWHSAWQDDSSGVYPVSVEKEVASRMSIGLGDELTFNIGSEVVKTRVTSLREVNWQTMQPNFFFVLHPDAMQRFSPTYITSFYLPAEQKPQLTQLLRPFGSVTLFDVDARITQLRDIVDQVSLAVEFILVLVLVAGSLVLIAQVQSSMDERQQELAILRTLGAKARLIRWSVLYEFIIIGAVAGGMAAFANELSLYLLQTRIFSLPATVHWEYWLVAPGVGAAVVGTLGALSCWHLLRFTTASLLRRLG